MNASRLLDFNSTIRFIIFEDCVFFSDVVYITDVEGTNDSLFIFIYSISWKYRPQRFRAGKWPWSGEFSSLVIKHRPLVAFRGIAHFCPEREVRGAALPISFVTSSWCYPLPTLIFYTVVHAAWLLILYSFCPTVKETPWVSTMCASLCRRFRGNSPNICQSCSFSIFLTDSDFRHFTEYEVYIQSHCLLSTSLIG